VRVEHMDAATESWASTTAWLILLILEILAVSFGLVGTGRGWAYKAWTTEQGLSQCF